MSPRARKLSGLVLDLPEAQYHSHPALSSTGAKRLLDSPARFDYWRSHPSAPKREFDVGSAIHAEVLGAGYEVVVLEFPDYRTKAAQEAQEEARAAGKIPVLRKVYDTVAPIRESVLANKTARAIFEQEHDAEASAFAKDPTTGIELRCRFDLLPRPTGGRRIAADLKSIGTSASPGDFARSAARFGYDVSQAHYLHTLEHALPGGADGLEFVFIVVEVEPPYLVADYALNREFVEIGQKKAEKARRLFAEHTASKEWPGYPDEVVLLPPPVFHVYDFQDNHQESIR